MKKILGILIFGFSASAFASTPAIDFTSVGSPSSFNSPAKSTATVGGITIDAFTYSSGDYTASQLFLRNGGSTSNELGFGVCSEGSCSSGNPSELSNTVNHEVIRLTLSAGHQWSDLFVSSLDTASGGEGGTLYWSNDANPILDSSLGQASFSHSDLGSAVKGSIWNFVPGINPNDKYLFFTSNASPNTDSGYLIWGASVSPVPEPSSYAMLLAGLGLLGFIAYSHRSDSSNMLMAA